MDVDVSGLLRAITLAPGVSGWEDPVRSEIERALKDVASNASPEVDELGNLYVKVGERPRAALIAHMDEIGFAVKSITEGGLIYLEPVGGWDDRVLLGERVVIYGSGKELEGLDWRDRAVVGVIGSKPIHYLRPEERDKAPKIQDLFVDLGLSSRSEIEKLVRIGDLAHLYKDFTPIPRSGSTTVASRGFDDRAGCVAVVLASKILAELRVEHYAVFTVQEEVGARGATVAGYKLHQEGVRLAVAIDVTHAGGYPGLEEKDCPTKLGQGPVISRGPPIPLSLSATFEDEAKRRGVPYQLGPEAGKTRTDLDVLQLARTGLKSMLISIPLKYMHTTVEVVDLRDVESAAKVMAYGIERALRK
jgi:endoglucanase